MLSFSQKDNFPKFAAIQESFLNLHKVYNTPGLSQKTKDVVRQTLEVVQKEIEKLSSLSVSYKITVEQISAMNELKKTYEDEANKKKMMFEMEQARIDNLEQCIAHTEEKIRRLKSSIKFTTDKEHVIMLKNRHILFLAQATKIKLRGTLEKIKERNQKIFEKYETAPQVVKMHEEEKLIQELNNKLEILAMEEKTVDERHEFLDLELADNKRTSFSDFVRSSTKALVKIREIKRKHAVVNEIYEKCMQEKAEKKEALRSSGRFDSFDVSMMSVDHNQTIDQEMEHLESISAGTVQNKQDDIAAAKKSLISRLINSPDVLSTETDNSNFSHDNEVIMIETNSSIGDNTTDDSQKLESGSDISIDENIAQNLDNNVMENDECEQENESSQNIHDNRCEEVPVEEEISDEEDADVSKTEVVEHREITPPVDEENGVTEDQANLVDLLTNEAEKSPVFNISQEVDMAGSTQNDDISNVLNMSVNSQDPGGDFLNFVEQSEGDNVNHSVVFNMFGSSENGDNEFNFNFGDADGDQGAFSFQFGDTTDNNEGGGDFFNLFK